MGNIKDQIKELAEAEEIELADDEISLVEELCHLLVKIDNYEHKHYQTTDKTYGYQQGLILLAREHNGQYGI